jgi:hypothetical protein
MKLVHWGRRMCRSQRAHRATWMGERRVVIIGQFSSSKLEPNWLRSTDGTNIFNLCASHFLLSSRPPCNGFGAWPHVQHKGVASSGKTWCPLATARFNRALQRFGFSMLSESCFVCGFFCLHATFTLQIDCRWFSVMLVATLSTCLYYSLLFSAAPSCHHHCY